MCSTVLIKLFLCPRNNLKDIKEYQRLNDISNLQKTKV